MLTPNFFWISITFVKISFSRIVSSKNTFELVGTVLNEAKKVLATTIICSLSALNYLHHFNQEKPISDLLSRHLFTYAI